MADYLPPPLPLASPISDHFAIRGTYFWGHVGTTGRFDSSTGVPGTSFTAEQRLGATDQARMPRVELIFRLEQRSRLRLDFIDLRRSEFTTLAAPLQFGSQSFNTGDPLSSTLDWRQTDFTYTYSILRGERYELGAGLGLHLIEAEAQAQVPATPRRADYNGAGPFVTLAVDGTWVAWKRWALSARAQYFKLTVSGVGGELGDYHADLQYRAWRNLAFGAGYDLQEVMLSVRHHNPPGIMRLHISGPELFARASF